MYTIPPPDEPISSLSSSSQNGPPSKTLPIILCLHGRGSNATILSFQMRLITARIGKTFEFLFLNGPYLSDAGPGILPWFEGMGPYYHWGSPTIGAPAGPGAAGGACGIDEEAGRERYESEAEEMRIVNEAVNRVLEEPEGKRVVGVLGFSQGTRVVSGLLRRQQILGDEVSRASIKFGILVCGGGGLSFFPFDLMPPQRAGDVDVPKDFKIRVPSLHVHGKLDEIARKGIEMVEALFEGRVARVMSVNAGHHFPRDREEVQEMCRVILDMWGPEKDWFSREFQS